MKMKSVVCSCFAIIITATSAVAEPVATPAAKSWLQAPDNDLEVAALGRAALTCPWLKYGFQNDCAPFKAWTDATAPFKNGRADSTLVNMLEDADHKARLLAARKLDKHGTLFRSDRNLAARVVAAAERERFVESDLAARLGNLVASIDVEGTELGDSIAALAKYSPLTLVRSYLTKSLPRRNPTSAAVRRIVEAAINDPQDEVRLSSAEAYQDVEAGAAESCAFWAANLTHKDPRVVGECADGLSAARCAKYHDELLVTLAKSDALAAPFSSMTSALKGLCENAAVTSAQRAQTTALALKIIEKAADTVGCFSADIRSKALDAVVACNPKTAKVYLRRFLTSSSYPLRAHAQELLKRP